MFNSHAQMGEDIRLWNALKDIKNGFYIDVGAQHPIADSVSLGFYEQGWRGIHVEPVNVYAALLRHHRPDELVIETALSDHDGPIEFTEFNNTGLSTAVAEFANIHKAKGLPAEIIQVNELTLMKALGKNVYNVVHWLKIDVEGYELEVLKGWDHAILRPWIIVVEATEPNTSISNHEKWEHILIAAGYDFVKFDGLNRFYVAKEHPELSGALS